MKPPSSKDSSQVIVLDDKSAEPPLIIKESKGLFAKI